MIPRTLHYCWFGPNAYSELNRRCIESWKRLLPGFEFKLWNERNSPLDNAYCRAAHDHGHWSRLSNYVRLHALHEEGGIYFDTDVEVLRRFDELLDNDAFLGFQQQEPGADWVNNAVMGATAGHPFLNACLEVTRNTHAQTGVFQRSPTVVTAVLLHCGLRRYAAQTVGGVTLFPTEYFYPHSWKEPFDAQRLTLNTYCIHHWEGTWWRPRPEAEADAHEQRIREPGRLVF